MASLYPKKVGGRTYWYLREMARVDGRPKMASERYLGTAAEIEALLDARESAMLPERTRHLAFGDVAAAWGMLQDLGVISVIDAVAGPRPAGQPLSTGTYLALAALNRLVAPCSKAAFADWWKTTAADRFTKVPASALDHRRFWDAMHAVTPAQLEQASEKIAAEIVRTAGIDVSSVALDMTNFATFIASGNGRAPIAQRGKAKQKRTDLRIVGLGLVVTRDGGIPLTWHAYPGDRPDVTQFPAMTDQLKARYEAVCAAAGLDLEAPDMTVVFDAGQNSEANLAHFAATRMHFIGSVPASDCPDLTALPASKRAIVDKEQFGGLTAFDTRRAVYGTDRRAILTHSPELHEAQAAGFTGTTLAKAGKKLGDLAATLARGKTRRPRDKVEAEIAAVTARPWVRRVVRWDLAGTQPKDLRLTWSVDPEARAGLEEEIFGKHVLITSHDDWPVAGVVAGYRSQSEAEFGFRQMKGPHVASFSPMHHWTDHNIRVHMFTCVLALQLAHLMRQRAARAGLRMSVRELLRELAAIGETVLIYPSTGGRPRARRLTTELTANQPELHRIFNLQRWAPASLGHTPKQPLAIPPPAETLTEDHDHRKLRLGRILPRTGRDPAQAAALLEDLADRALRSQFEPVLCLEAPEAAEVPRELLRADGRSVYRRHGGVRYATRAQLSMEERMAAQAAAQGAPRMTRADAAQALGADIEHLEHALAGRATDAGRRTGSGLREDQAAAALSVLTDGRRVSVINAPAGSGKTRVLAEVARAWAATGLGPVIGITASQSARNTLAAGVTESYNSAQFLGHLPGQRGARGPHPVAPGLLVIDEASMMTSLDLADLITLAETNGGKVIAAGDTMQLQAVQNGGGMSLLADRLGYVRLTEPVRFRAKWEQAASLRLRDGDATVLADYDQHARINGGDPEQMIDAAAAAYVALTLEDTDSLLMTADHSLRRELSRRIRDDLIRLGRVDPGPAVTIADGATASRGDLIIATRNDHRVEAGEPGRTLANGDLLRIDAVTSGGLLVRRALDTDRKTGRRRWTDHQFLYAHFDDAELGYAVTDHVAQGRTVTAGLAVIAGTEDRQHAYVALTRGTHENTAYVFTHSPKLADPAPGPRPAPELARYDHLTGQRADLVAAVPAAETTPAHEQRYQQLLTAALPPRYQQEPTHQAKWLWRTLHAAELAGLDARQVLADAVGERDLVGARDVAAVIDARIRRRTATLIPLPAPSWSAQIPAIADPDRAAYAGQIAGLMDARKERIGEHAAASSLPWAVSALGPVPGDAEPRLDWQRRASSIGAYRELSGYNHPADPIGPEPATGTPELRAAWYEALAALGPADGPDLRGMADGLLIHLRDTYPVETAWAPPWAGDQLRQARVGVRDARLAALRATAEAGIARRQGDHERATRQQALAASYQALHGTYQRHEAVLAATMADRAAWECATRQQRQLAVAADAELRRRHPDQRWPALRSAEPQLPAQPQGDDPAPMPGPEGGETAQWIADLAARHRDFAARLAERHKMTPSAEAPSPAERKQVVLAWAEPQGDAILQPPRPQIQPSQQVLERVTGRDLNMELAD